MIIGNLTLDEIVMKTKNKVYKGVLGGPPAYSSKPLYSIFKVKPKIYTTVGKDFPEKYENELKTISKLFIYKVEEPTTKFKLVEGNGRKLFMLSFSGEIRDVDFNVDSVYMFSPVYREVRFDYLKKAHTLGLVSLDPQGFLREVNEEGEVTLNFNSELLKHLKYIDIFRTSLDEFSVLSRGVSIRNFLEKTIKSGCEVSVVTSSTKIYALKENTYYEYPAYTNVRVESTTGAGDVFTSIFTYVYSRSNDVVKALIYAIVASSFTVETVGPRVIDEGKFYVRLKNYMEFLGY